MSTQYIDFNKAYQQEKYYWGEQPSKFVNIILKYITKGKALDLGAGEGRNAIFLAKKGFDVTAVDISQVGLDKIYDWSNKLGLTVETELADLKAFRIRDFYDLIISNATFHFLAKTHVRKIISQMKQQTKIGGINGISAFNKDNEIWMPYLFQKGELSKLYHDWDILETKDFTFSDKHGKNGKIHYHAISIVIAQKVDK
jgi:tellurite methyltransferase